MIDDCYLCEFVPPPAAAIAAPAFCPGQLTISIQQKNSRYKLAVKGRKAMLTKSDREKAKP